MSNAGYEADNPKQGRIHQFPSDNVGIWPPYKAISVKIGSFQAIILARS
jgi:hypothetical protein